VAEEDEDAEVPEEDEEGSWCLGGGDIAAALVGGQGDGRSRWRRRR
jgi:hypothetical protein